MQIKITKNTEKANEYKIEIIGTLGWLFAIKNALEYYSNGACASPIAKEILGYFTIATEKANIEFF